MELRVQAGSFVDHEALLRRHGSRPEISLFCSARHVRPDNTADDICGVVGAAIGTISHQALYDALAALIDMGFLRCIQPARSPARYENMVGDDHHHLICQTCTRMVDVGCALGNARGNRNNQQRATSGSSSTESSAA